MENQVLLTYKTDKGTNFEWFEDEEEMNEFVKSHNVIVLEAWLIQHAKRLK